MDFKHYSVQHNFERKVTIWKMFEEFSGKARKGRSEFLLVKIAASYPQDSFITKTSKFKIFLIDKIDRIRWRILTTFL